MVLTAGSEGVVHSARHDKPAAGYNINHWNFYADGATIHSTQAATKRHTEGANLIAWHFTADATHNAARPLKMEIAQIPVVANQTLTVTGWILKDHGTNVEAKLCIKGGDLAGVATDQFSTDVGNHTDYQQKTVTALPTEAGVLIVEAWVWYVAGVSQVYVDDVGRSQA